MRSYYVLYLLNPSGNILVSLRKQRIVGLSTRNVNGRCLIFLFSSPFRFVFFVKRVQSAMIWEQILLVIKIDIYIVLKYVIKNSKYKYRKH